MRLGRLQVGGVVHTGRTCGLTGCWGKGDSCIPLANIIVTPEGRGAVNAPAKTELGANVASEVAGGSHHAGFDLDFGGFAIELAQQLVNLGNGVGNIVNDERVSAVI